MNTKLKDAILKELDSRIQTLENTPGTEDKQEALFKLSGDIQNGITTDNELRKFMAINSDYYFKNFGIDVPELVETTKLAMGKVPDTKLDFAKIFGEDWYKDDVYYNIPRAKLEYVAKNNGTDLAGIMDQMSNEKTRIDRYNIMHGKDDESGVYEDFAAITGDVLTPNIMKAGEQGRDPTTGEIVGDVVRDVSYSLPTARMAKVAGNAGRGLVGAAIGYGAAPTVEHGANYALGNESGSDAAIGTATGFMTNALVPYILRRGAMAVGNKIDAAKPVAKKLEEFGTGSTGKEIKQPYIDKAKQYKSLNSADGYKLDVNEYPTVKAIEPSTNYRNTLKDFKVSNGETEYRAADILTGKGEKDLGIIYQPGKTFEEKYVSWLKTHPDISKDMSEETKDYLYKAFKNWEPYEQLKLSRTIRPTDELIAEDIALNNVTNRIGEELYDRGMILNKFPYAGQAIKQYQEDKKRDAYNDSLINRAIEDLKAKNLYYEDK